MRSNGNQNASRLDETSMMTVFGRTKVGSWVGTGWWSASNPARARACHGKSGGGTRFLVACSNVYASRNSVGSLHAIPVKLTPNGAGLA